MKLLQRSGVAFVCAAVAATVHASDCALVAESVTQQVENAPEKVLMIVEDAMASHDKCACEIVKAAIVASKANERLVGEIVFAAVIASESMAPTVAECAISVAPDSASQIRSALKKALSDGGPAGSGKAPVADSKNPYYGKEPVPAAEPVRDDGGFAFGRAPLDVRGIYLLAPSPGVVSTRDFDIPKSLLREFKRRFGYYPDGLDRDEIVKILKRTNKQSGSSGGKKPPGGVTPSDPIPKKD